MGAALFAIRPPWVKGELDAWLPFQTGLGLVIGFVISQYVGLRVSADKASREVILAAARDAREDLRKLEVAVDSCVAAPTDDRWQATRLPLKVLGAAIVTIEKLMKECRVEDQVDPAPLKSSYEKLRRALGDKSIRKAAADPALSQLAQELYLLSVRLARTMG